VYARHKRQVEEMLLERGDALIVRTAWVFGTAIAPKNFMAQVVLACRTGRRMTLPAGQAGCPTWSRWLAASTLTLLAQGMDGVVHVSGGELLTKAAWAELLIARLRLPPCEVFEAPWEQSGQVAPRPMQVALRSERHGLVQPPLRDLLDTHRDRFVAC
jgi:dTDP-4-dehydrorhamnose reductase